VAAARDVAGAGRHRNDVRRLSAADCELQRWHGGWAFGPRYLVSVIPLLGVPMLFAIRVARPLWIVLALLSVSINFIATAVDPMTPDKLRHPIAGYLLPVFFTGALPESTARELEVSYRAVDKVALQREAGNLGESVFPKGTRKSVVPIALWLGVGGAWILRNARR
jgi:hypothetical protein